MNTVESCNELEQTLLEKATEMLQDNNQLLRIISEQGEKLIHLENTVKQCRDDMASGARFIKGYAEESSNFRINATNDLRHYLKHEVMADMSRSLHAIQCLTEFYLRHMVAPIYREGMREGLNAFCNSKGLFTLAKAAEYYGDTVTNEVELNAILPETLDARQIIDTCMREFTGDATESDRIVKMMFQDIIDHATGLTGDDVTIGCVATYMHDYKTRDTSYVLVESVTNDKADGYDLQFQTAVTGINRKDMTPLLKDTYSDRIILHEGESGHQQYTIQQLLDRYKQGA